MNAAGLPASAVRGGIRTPLACLISLSTYLTVPTHKKHFLFSRIADPLGCLPPVSNTGVVKPLRRETWKLYELLR